MNYKSFCSTELIICTQEQAENEMEKLAGMSILLILSRSGAARWGLQGVIELLQSQNKVIWIDRHLNNPTPMDIYDALKLTEGINLDLILAVGGGSTIDLAKAVSALQAVEKVPEIDEIIMAIENGSYKEKQIYTDIIAFPTTAGTGSELTPWATVWDMDKSKKFSIECPQIQPRAARIVPAWTCSLSPRLTLLTGLDALAHAIEAYWSKKSDVLVRQMAYEGIRLVMENLKAAAYDLGNIELREKMCMASVLSGLAFSQTRTTACHSISYPLTIYHHIPHGLAAAITLDKIFDINAGYFNGYEGLLELFKQFGGLSEWLTESTSGIVRLQLSEWGIKEEDLDNIVIHAFTTGRMDNNPVEITKNQVRTLLTELL